VEKQTETTDELSSVPLSVWLDALEEERRALIMRLRQIERNLIAHGRLRPAAQPERTGKRTGTGR
jgi:hypothetical protein